MNGKPRKDEAAAYYFTYIDRVVGDDVVGAIERQLETSLALYLGISEEKSMHRYAPEKWSIRQVLNHVTDTERAFAFRALWFGRGFETPLPVTIRTLPRLGRRRTGYLGRCMWKSFGGCGNLLFHCVGICRSRLGRGLGLLARIGLACGRWLTLLPGTWSTTI